MSQTHKPFRELIKPNSNFEFIDKRRTWALISTIAVLACIGMLFLNKSLESRGEYLNWTIDFQGGSELIFSFEDSDGTPHPIEAGVVRKALSDAGKEVDVSEFSWSTKNAKGESVDAAGMLVRTKEFGALTETEQEKIAEAFSATFAEQNVLKSRWSGDRMFVRAAGPIAWDAANSFFTEHGQVLQKWSEEDSLSAKTAVAGTGEYKMHFSVDGMDNHYASVLAKSIGDGVVVKVVNYYGVGAKAGEKLRNDGLKSLFYVMALIMLYLAFRFDVRYAPGAVVALLHDVILVIGVFAATWQSVSLSTVAALLTVIGYSVNDSVVIFDRIRENVVRLKDKKFARVINISLNETMARTLLTSITLFAVTLMMNILGEGLVRNFAFALNIGVVVGVYSSIFIASPVALGIHNRWYSGPAPKTKKKK